MRNIVELDVLCHSTTFAEREKAASLGVALDEPDLWLKMSIDFTMVQAVKVDNDSEERCIIHFANESVIARLTYGEAVILLRKS